MRTILLFIINASVLISCSGQKEINTIKLNSLGYKPASIKKASIVGIGGVFKVLDVITNNEVFSGKLQGPYTQSDVNQYIYIANFSSLKTVGEYYIELADATKSDHFGIAKNAYDLAYKTSMEAFYLWRCGTDIEYVFGADTFKQEACHLHDGYYDFTEFGNKHKDGTGGWHDAGDYGKYIVNGGISLGQLFMGWQDFKVGIEKIKSDIPYNSETLPEYLEELKWETDWFLKMQYPDNSGRVSHKLTPTNFSGFIMPHNDTSKRYFTQWGTAATAYFVGAMAIASRNFAPYNVAYAQQCLDAAKKSYQFLVDNPEYVRWDQEDFYTGGYQPKKNDGLMWAAAEMWETTGETSYLKDFEERIVKADDFVDYTWDWGNIKNLAVYTYLLSDKEGRNDDLLTVLKAEMLRVADSIVDFTVNDVYGRPTDKYSWGCNGTIARLASNLYVASQLNEDKKYKDAAEEIAAHIFGRNYYNRSYVTGLGKNPPLNPHDRRCGADGIENPWPGYIVGGGHTATDWIDEQASFSHNEICINWQASLVYLMAWMVTE